VVVWAAALSVAVAPWGAAGGSAKAAPPSTSIEPLKLNALNRKAILFMTLLRPRRGILMAYQSILPGSQI
jgi:hypothetical protein